MSSLAESEKRSLLKIARRALTLAVEHKRILGEFEPPPEEKFPETFLEPGGAFVTLRARGRLRGCIGQLASSIPLIHVVAYCAAAAALEDPRFTPVVEAELTEIDLELSILSFPEDLKPEEIEPGRHGLIVTRGAKRGLLLPQVATEFGWSAERFLEETCMKAGIERNAWKDSDARIQAFIAEVFSETTLAAKEEKPA